MRVFLVTFTFFRRSCAPSFLTHVLEAVARAVHVGCQHPPPIVSFFLTHYSFFSTRQTRHSTQTRATRAPRRRGAPRVAARSRRTRRSSPPSRRKARSAAIWSASSAGARRTPRRCVLRREHERVERVGAHELRRDVGTYPVWRDHHPEPDRPDRAHRPQRGIAAGALQHDGHLRDMGRRAAVPACHSPTTQSRRTSSKSGCANPSIKVQMQVAGRDDRPAQDEQNEAEIKGIESGRAFFSSMFVARKRPPTRPAPGGQTWAAPTTWQTGMRLCSIPCARMAPWTTLAAIVFRQRCTKFAQSASSRQERRHAGAFRVPPARAHARWRPCMLR